ncbi:MAG: antibiotic resistance protein MarC, partial [Methanothrix sp.]
MGINDYLLYFVYAFTTVFVIVNPVEATMIFVTLTTGMNPQEKSHIYRRTTLVAFSIAIL